MDVQFTKASRTVRQRRFEKRAAKVADKIVRRYLTNINKKVEPGTQTRLVRGLTDRIVSTTKRDIDLIVSREPVEFQGDDAHLDYLAKNLNK